MFVVNIHPYTFIVDYICTHSFFTLYESKRFKILLFFAILINFILGLQWTSFSNQMFDSFISFNYLEFILGETCLKFKKQVNFLNPNDIWKLHMSMIFSCVIVLLCSLILNMVPQCI
jgi:hypothetical protein